MAIKRRGGSGAPAQRDPGDLLRELRLLGSMTPLGMMTNYNMAVADKAMDVISEPGSPEAMERAENQRGMRPRKEGPAPGTGTPEAMARAKNQRGMRSRKEEEGSEPSETRTIYAPFRSPAKFIPQEISELIGKGGVEDLLSIPPEDIGELEAAVAEQDDEAMEAMAKEAASTCRDLEEALAQAFVEAAEGAAEGAASEVPEPTEAPEVSDEPTEAPEVSDEQLMADFEVAHGGPFDPVSSMDKGKMEIIRRARARYPDATSTQLALRIYRGEFG